MKVEVEVTEVAVVLHAAAAVISLSSIHLRCLTELPRRAEAKHHRAQRLRVARQPAKYMTNMAGAA